ncbi:lytic transglycosylase, partial [Xanthomonas perforans]
MINSTIAFKYVDKVSNWQWEASSGLSPKRRMR